MFTELLKKRSEEIIMSKIIAFFTSIIMAISSFFGSIFPGSIKGLEKTEMTDELRPLGLS